MDHIKKFEEFDFNNNKTFESIGETKLQRFYKRAFGLFLSPITIPIFANFSTDLKIKALKKIVIENYIEEMAEYELLDNAKYDISQPSILNKIFKRLKMIRKKKDKYKTINDYMRTGIKFMRFCNLINFRNREDIDYIEDELKNFFSQKTDDEWIEEYKKTMSSHNGIVRKKIGDFGGWDRARPEDLIDEVRPVRDRPRDRPGQGRRVAG